MYVCKPGFLMRIICWLLMLVLLPEVVFCLHMLTLCPVEERTVYLGGALMFGALCLALLWRLVRLGAAWLEYDDEKLIFHLRCDDEFAVPWAEIPSSAVMVQPEGRNLMFRFGVELGFDREQKLLLTPMFSGYRDFKQECERRGLIMRPFTAKQAYEQMVPYLDRLFNEVEKKKNEIKK